MLTCGAEGEVIEANPAARRMLGLGEDAHPGGANLLALLSGERLPDLWAAPGGTAIGGLEVAFGDGRAALFDAHAGAGGEVECALAEVTDLRRAAWRAETLLREVYHRVYNNLQVMDALLALQAAKHADPAVREGYREVSQRLRALALVQQRLHRGDDFASLDFADYLRDLASAVEDAVGRPEVSLVVEGAPELRLPIDTAVPLGLLATELLTNACKHAFPEARGPGDGDARARGRRRRAAQGSGRRRRDSPGDLW
jgi:hypothetical protein